MSIFIHRVLHMLGSTNDEVMEEKKEALQKCSSSVRSDESCAVSSKDDLRNVTNKCLLEKLSRVTRNDIARVTAEDVKELKLLFSPHHYSQQNNTEANSLINNTNNNIQDCTEKGISSKHKMHLNQDKHIVLEYCETNGIDAEKLRVAMEYLLQSNKFVDVLVCASSETWKEALSGLSVSQLRLFDSLIQKRWGYLHSVLPFINEQFLEVIGRMCKTQKNVAGNVS